jgi:hypothetical protein
LWIDLQNFRISRIESQDILGNTNKIIIESLTPVPNLDQKLFQMDIPQTTKVFDSEGKELNQNEVEQLKNKIVQERELIKK